MGHFDHTHAYCQVKSNLHALPIGRSDKFNGHQQNHRMMPSLSLSLGRKKGSFWW